MLDFIGELLVEMLISPIINWAVAAAWWLVRSGILLAMYPFLLLTGWLRLWLRERGRIGWLGLWRTHGAQGLHRFGWQEAVLDLQYLLATLLLVAAASGVGIGLYVALHHLSL